MQVQLIINATMLNNPALIGLGVYTLQVLRHLLPVLRKSDRYSNIRIVGDREQLSRHFADQQTDLNLEFSHLGGTNPLARAFLLNRKLKHLSRGQATHFYSPTHHGVTTAGIRQIITIHDLFPLMFPRQNRLQYLYFRFYLPSVLARSAAVISVSDSTAADLKRFFPEAPASTTVHESVREDLRNATPVPVAQVTDRRFFLYVGPNLPHKNAERTVEAFFRYAKKGEATLVIAGGSYKQLARIKRLVSGQPYPESGQIILLGYVSNEELAWLYKQALAVILATLSEGFGLPALEAMHFGCPVIASNVGALPEVCGSAAHFVNPYDVESITAAMHTLDQKDERRQSLRKLGLDNVRRFSWEEAAARIQHIMNSLSH